MVKPLRAPLVATATKEGVRKEPWGVVILVMRAEEPGFVDWWRSSCLKKGFSENVDLSK